MMASVSSLDKDLRKVRLEKFTPAAANEVRNWIEEVLGERLSSGDLLEGLKDGVALCKLVNLAVPPPGVKFKQSAMPFVQMENISIFLRACQAPPLNLHQHDTFLTVDLFEQKDPAQVLQCLGAFSRAANAANPSRFPRALGPKTRGGVVSPQGTGPTSTSAGLRDRGTSVTSNTSSGYGGNRTLLASKTGDSASGRRSPTKSPTHDSTVSSWSKKEHESGTSPAWNIAQYGYMGGASQGNLGIVYGARRQITSTGPKVPSLADKERMRKEEEERLRQEAEEEEHRRRADQEAEERRAQAEEQQRWEVETRRLRAEERRKADDEKRRWEEEERQWKLTEERRRKEEEAAEARMDEERKRARGRGDVKLQGQFLSQYQADQGKANEEDEYKNRIEQLEKELDEARQREAEYEKERLSRGSRPPVEAEVTANRKSKSRSRSRAAAVRAASNMPSRQDSWSRDEREVLRTSWNQHRASPNSDPLSSPPTKSPRPLPDPTATATKPQSPGGSARPLPDPANYSSPPQSRTDRFLSSNPAPSPPQPQQTYSRELDATSERDAEDRRRQQSQGATKAGGWASKSLLEREMEMERERQREWEEAQKETAANAAARPPGDNGVDGIGGGIGGRWDVGQWSGYTGGDGQNKGSQGIGASRRQIVGPRPLPGSK